MEEVIANSFRDYHVSGFDYLCLKRSPTETVKIYFFDGDVAKLPEVVNPHDHRYDFKTMVLAGASQNIWYEEAGPRAAGKNEGKIFERFAYDTPLLGGGGFVHVGQTRLVETSRRSYKAGQNYTMGFREVHTIRMLQNETILCLVQNEDRVKDRPTLTFTRHEEPPNLEGMYRKFTPDGIVARLKNLRDRVPYVKLPRVA